MLSRPATLSLDIERFQSFISFDFFFFFRLNEVDDLMVRNGVTNVFILNWTQSLHSQGINEAKWYQMQKEKKGRANMAKDIDLTPLKLKTTPRLVLHMAV